jgi:diacylglycerol kinase
MKKLISSIGFALKGIKYALATESNIRLQLLVFILVVIASMLLQISRIDFLLVLLVSAIIFSLELCNTAIERLADKVSPEYNEQIAVVKDLMAGAVLVFGIFSFAIGCIIFYQPLQKFFQQ